ncbi:MAG: HEAT repeat domain-containing protein [Planctomycetes bacterium]|nr:HEAT repeat domain-containing protein [Planctomycetota bacterium]
MRILCFAAALAAVGCRASPTPNVRSGDAYERYLGAIEAVRMRDPIAVSRLEMLLRDPDPLARTGAVVAVGLSGTSRASALVQPMLSDPDPGVRIESCRVLAACGDRGAMETMLKLLSGDERLEVRRTAALALSAFGDGARLRAGLTAALADSSAAVAYNAHESLRLILERDDVPRQRTACEEWLKSVPPPDRS